MCSRIYICMYLRIYSKVVLHWESTLVNYINNKKMHTVFVSILRRALVHLQHVVSTHLYYGVMACHSENTEPNNLSGVVFQTDSETGFFLIWLCNTNIFMWQLIPASFHKRLKNVSFLQMNSSPYMASNCLGRCGRSRLVCLQIWEKGFKYGSQQQKLAEQWRTFPFSPEGRVGHPLKVQLTTLWLTYKCKFEIQFNYSGLK